MRAVGISFNEDRSAQYSPFTGETDWRLSADWMGQYKMTVRYDNGQLCTFRRKQPAKPSVPPETGA